MPGGGGLRVTNHLYNIAAKDGTAMATVQRGLLTSPLLEARNLQLQYDPMKFNWLGSLNSETGLIVVWHTAPHKTMEDLFKTELLVGSSSRPPISCRCSSTMCCARSSRSFPATRAPPRPTFAVERGELQGAREHRMGGGQGCPRTMDEGQQGSFSRAARIGEEPEFPDVPLILDYARTEQEKQAMELILAAQAMGQAFRDAARRAAGPCRRDAQGVQRDDEG